VIDRLGRIPALAAAVAQVRAGLSAGRVQSVAVRWVVDRETDIDAFVPSSRGPSMLFLPKMAATRSARGSWGGVATRCRGAREAGAPAPS